MFVVDHVGREQAKRRSDNFAQHGPAAAGTAWLSLLVAGLQVVLTSILFVSLASAESGQSYKTFGLKCGYTMTVDDNWVNGSGYRPFRIEISTIKGTPAVSTTRFRVEIQTYSWQGQVATVSGDLVMEQGQKNGATTISIPQPFSLSGGQVRVSNGGVELRELTMQLQDTGQDGSNGQGLALLVIDKDAPSLSQRAARRESMRKQVQPPDLPNTGALPNIYVLMKTLPFHTAGYYNRPNDTQILGMFDGNAHASLQNPSDLPDRWIDLTCFDVAIISWDDLQLLAKQHPEQFQALREWASSGATLCVYGVGDDFSRRGNLEELLFGQSFDGAGFGGWTVPRTSDRQATLRNDTPQPAMIYGRDDTSMAEMAVTDASAQPEEFETRPKPLTQPSNAIPPFLLHDFGVGLVVAIGSTDPFPGAEIDWSWLLNSINANRWSWGQRHGLNPGQPSASYWEHLIPGVGQPPVNAFRFLITVFVLVIGPVNYHLLRRAGRLHLLLLTVPIGAGVVTFGLIGYALLADGLGVRARIRSYTYLDQRNESAACWSRQSYYAGMAPSGGLRFPEDAAVYFVDPGFQRHQQNRYGMQWNPNGQQLSQGYIKSRVTSQFLVVRARQTLAQLVVKETTAGDGLPEIENLLRSRIHYLVLADSNGKLFFAEDIKDGEKLQPKAINASSELNTMRKVFLDNRPIVSQDYTTANRLMMAEVAAPNTNDSSDMLERNINRIQNLGVGSIKPKSYLAIVDQSPEVPLGAKNAREEKSFHVVEGVW